jgi:alpha-tubulin suppressor-like RCC1 family protein
VALDDASLTGDTGFLELGKGGSNHGCGISTERKAYCWGANTSGQLGSGSTSGSAVHLPLPVDMSNLGSTNRSFLSVTAGEAHSCGVSGIGDAFCWGSNTSGRLGIGNADTTAVAVRPEPVHTGNAALFTASYSKKFVHVGTGTAHACGLAADANIYCWGSNALGQLGTSSVAGASVEPARVDWSGAVGTPIQLTVGAYHSCALTDRGTAYCWGEDANDKLGDGVGSTNQSTPRLVTGASRFVELTAGVQHTCALDGERNVYCWGDGSKLQLGTTTTADEPNPAAITTGFGTADVKFAHLSAGFEHTCGVTSKGGAYCWGTDGAGRLGIDSAQASLDVPSEDDVSLPAAGTTWPKLEVGCASRTCAITQSGKLYCWGSDAYGALGNWTTTGDQDVPSAVSLLAL